MKKSAIILTLVFQLSLLIGQNSDTNATGNWSTRTINESMTHYYSHGTTVWGHQFGFLKWAEKCAADQLLISWSSYMRDSTFVWDGMVIPVRLTAGDITTSYTMQVIASKKYSESLTVLYMVTDEPTKELLGHVQLTDSITVELMPYQVFENQFDVLQDIFSLHGLTESRAEALKLCNKQK